MVVAEALDLPAEGTKDERWEFDKKARRCARYVDGEMDVTTLR